MYYLLDRGTGGGAPFNNHINHITPTAQASNLDERIKNKKNDNGNGGLVGLPSSAIFFFFTRGRLADKGQHLQRSGDSTLHAVRLGEGLEEGAEAFSGSSSLVPRAIIG